MELIFRAALSSLVGLVIARWGRRENVELIALARDRDRHDVLLAALYQTRNGSDLDVPSPRPAPGGGPSPGG